MGGLTRTRWGVRNACSQAIIPSEDSVHESGMGSRWMLRQCWTGGTIISSPWWIGNLSLECDHEPFGLLAWGACRFEWAIFFSINFFITHSANFIIWFRCLLLDGSSYLNFHYLEWSQAFSSIQTSISLIEHHPIIEPPMKPPACFVPSQYSRSEASMVVWHQYHLLYPSHSGGAFSYDSKQNYNFTFNKWYILYRERNMPLTHPCFLPFISNSTCVSPRSSWFVTVLGHDSLSSVALAAALSFILHGGCWCLFDDSHRFRLYCLWLLRSNGWGHVAIAEGTKNEDAVMISRNGFSSRISVWCRCHQDWWTRPKFLLTGSNHKRTWVQSFRLRS